MSFQTLNPATGELIKFYGEESPSSVDHKIERSYGAWKNWAHTPVEKRAALLKQAARILKEKKEIFASLITLEMGKPVRQAMAEVEKSALVCEYYANEGPSFLQPESILTESKRSYIRFDSIGPVLAIMPWNFPFWQVFRFAAPTLLAGNTGILKHAPNVPASALAIESIFLEAGFPDGVFINVFAGIDDTSRIIADPRVRGVTLTGSEAAGRHVGAAAGRALKKSVLELGGSDPFIILPDADLDLAVSQAVISRTQNSGQSCIAAKRFIVHEKVADPFLQKFEEALSRLKVGNPNDPETDMGPLARSDLRDEIHDQLSSARAEGARLQLGGEIPEGPGFFYPATLVTNVRPIMKVARKETFGPLAAVIPVSSHEEAIEVANESQYGLGASIWTTDDELAHHMASQIESGSVFINAMVKSDPRLPFGGVKNSGYGRELSREGIREFTNIKTILQGR